LFFLIHPAQNSGKLFQGEDSTAFNDKTLLAFIKCDAGIIYLSHFNCNLAKIVIFDFICLQSAITCYLSDSFYWKRHLEIKNIKEEILSPQANIYRPSAAES
jgi:hypothetical protein